jgi:hypothetical protein
VKFHIGGTVNFDRIILENILSTASRYLGGPEHVVRPVGIKITNSYLVTVFTFHQYGISQQYNQLLKIYNQKENIMTGVIDPPLP